MTLRLPLAALAAVTLLTACDPLLGGGGGTTTAPTETTATGAPDLDSSELDDGLEGVPDTLDPTNAPGGDSALEPELTLDDQD